MTNDIVNLIPFGKENAISRKELAAKSGCTDRRVRQGIEDARVSGEIIVNLQNGRGYYRVDPKNMTEADRGCVEAQMKINRARAMSILVQQKHLRRALANV